MRIIGASLGLTVIGSLVLFSYLNCGKFKPSEEVSSRSLGMSAHISHDAEASVLVNRVINFNLSGNGIEGSEMAWSYLLNSAPTGCGALGALNSPNFSLSCANPGDLIVRAQLFQNGQTFIATSNLTILPDGGFTSTTTSITVTSVTVPRLPSVVEFQIPPGTGNTAWNTSVNPINVAVGQTLRIVNGDSVNHAIHTNGVPFPHGNTIAPGASESRVATAPYDSRVSGPLYDHIFQGANPRPDIWINAIDGAQVYSTRCFSCHGTLSESEVRGATATSIRDAIVTVSEMSGLANVLTSGQIDALVFVLRE
jgi:hypothetical protein